MSVNINDQNNSIYTNDINGVLTHADHGGFILPSGNGNSTTIAANLVDGTITYTAVVSGPTGNNISIAYVGGATAGSEVVTVINNAITVKIAAGVSTGTQIATAVNLSSAATALVTVTGTDASTRNVMAATNLSGAGQKPLAANGLIRYNTTSNRIEAVVNGNYVNWLLASDINSSYLPLIGGSISGTLGIIPGSVSTPGLYFNGNVSTGIFFNTSPSSLTMASNTLSITTNGTIALSVDAAQNVTVKTQAQSDNSTNIATTAFVQQAIGSIQSIPSGAMMPYAGLAAPSGWLLCYGQTLSTSAYANLFAAIGYTYGGSGPSFNLPDLRGRVVAGLDNMGGTAANRITTGGSGISGTTLGAAGGAETNVMTTDQMPEHSHVVNDPSHTHEIPVVNSSHAGSVSGEAIYQYSGPGEVNYATTGITIDNAGSGDAFSITQPTLIANYIIKT